MNQPLLIYFTLRRGGRLSFDASWEPEEPSKVEGQADSDDCDGQELTPQSRDQRDEASEEHDVDAADAATTGEMSEVFEDPLMRDGITFEIRPLPKEGTFTLVTMVWSYDDHLYVRGPDTGGSPGGFRSLDGEGTQVERLATYLNELGTKVDLRTKPPFLEIHRSFDEPPISVLTPEETWDSAMHAVEDQIDPYDLVEKTGLVLYVSPHRERANV